MATAAKKTKPEVPNAGMQVMTIPLHMLTLSKLNVRKIEPTDEEVNELAENIYANGLLQNLIVIPERAHGANGKPMEGRYEVVGGGRRYRALDRLDSQERLSHPYDVACLITTEAEAIALSLTENQQREQLHPVDEALAFSELVARKFKKAAIAARFGVTPRYVDQRLKLASLPPALTRACQEGRMPLEILQAFTLTDDLPKQLEVWDNISADIEEYDPADVRDMLTEQVRAEDDPIVKFVGISEYIAAGGTFLADLFSDEEDQCAKLLTDVKLLNKLAEKKLRKAAKQVQAEGWKWVKVEAGRTNMPDRFIREFTRPYTDEERAELTKLHAEEKEINDNDTVTEEQDQRLSEIEARINAIEAAAEDCYDPQEMALAGALVTIHSWKPEAKVIRGYVLEEDEAALDALQVERVAMIEANKGFQALGETTPDDAPQAPKATPKPIDYEKEMHRAKAEKAALMARMGLVRAKLEEVQKLMLEYKDDRAKATDLLASTLSLINDVLLAE